MEVAPDSNGGELAQLRPDRMIEIGGYGHRLVQEFCACCCPEKGPSISCEADGALFSDN
ncbi:MAG TPA: hypothetical protein VIK18_17695 [Pirellulales bacterium]